MLRVIQSSEICGVLKERQANTSRIDAVVAEIIENVIACGDKALYEYARRYDSFFGACLLAPTPFPEASADLLSALERAGDNIRRFAELQLPKSWSTELEPGLTVGQIIRPLQKVGAYIPGGLHPLPSTLLMTVIPAQVAGVEEIVICGPKPANETLATARWLGVDRFYRCGGAQAIAAMAIGTETVPKVDKIVGPGNAYVASAKKQLAGVVAIDMVAGPTEVVIVADDGRPDWIAADLLAQAEHDRDASAILITKSPKLIDEVRNELTTQLADLPTASRARESLILNGLAILSTSDEETTDIVNDIAPEHLCLHDISLLSGIKNAGSVFLGPHSAEPLGDYATGPNHVLPTGGAGRARGGLSAADFVKVITVQEASPKSVNALAKTIGTLARTEGLEAHARAVEIRL